MANTDILPPDTTNRPAPPLPYSGETIHLTEIKEEGVFASLVSSFRDVFFPEKLPPLVLQSKPIAVPDLMATKMTKKSVAMSISFYALLCLLLAFLVAHHVQITAPARKAVVLTEMVPPPPAPPKADKMGGGGGAHDLAPVSQGHLPKFAQTQIVPPKAPPTIPPKLAVEPTVVVQPDLKMANNTMPNIGMPNSNLSGISMGNGSGGGIGSGNGNGIGPGSGGNMGGGVYHVGGGISGPVGIYMPEPEFSEEARKAKFAGNVEVYAWIDEQGNTSHVRVTRGVGMGLDEKAIEAVRQYKFKPCRKEGKPVKCDINIDVNFQIF